MFILIRLCSLQFGDDEISNSLHLHACPYLLIEQRTEKVDKGDKDNKVFTKIWQGEGRGGGGGEKSNGKAFELKRKR